MSKRHPYVNVRDEDDDKKDDHRRQERREVVQAKRWIGSGEDGDSAPQLTEVNKLDDYQAH